MVYIFDFDGTIVNSMEEHITCYEKAFKHISPYCCGSDLKKILRNNLSKGIEEVCRILEFDQSEIGYLKKMKDLYFDMLKLKIELNLKAVQFILDDKVENKYIISNARKKTITDLLELHKIDTHFKKILSREDFENCKPHPEMGLSLIESEKLDPKDCVYFGDSDVDKEFSKNCGFHFKKIEVK